MLRRKPTALTITSEDIAAFEETYLRKLAYARYLKTGEDPDGLFSREAEGAAARTEQGTGTATGTGMTGTVRSVSVSAPGSGVIDPNDELKPLPGDRARIVRSREERIMGAGGAAMGAGR
ncbi:hypothetical protein PV10_06662 [Exophiala mesophila]|uniref:Uncharacterized protein n=1 Tax=Exophiala mesophila TaxID=212818 RepID=A0A0D1ZZD0_EXOME|nr:uncharacterized protein PV10_06662 [Exophiala mesophila]KIV92203.1 hypothetical protein PV10_06662 [Exophiala mesophila]